MTLHEAPASAPTPSWPSNVPSGEQSASVLSERLVVPTAELPDLTDSLYRSQVRAELRRLVGTLPPRFGQSLPLRLRSEPAPSAALRAGSERSEGSGERWLCVSRRCFW